MTPMELESDSLSSLEERIQQAVQLVGRLRQERDVAVEQVSGVQAEVTRLGGEVARLTAELSGLQAERKQVRGRIERLLDQIDQINPK